ncbi:putative membrane-associated kinase regulator 4 [Ananas comosus]|uniref:Putative membrane-associated kinase regulator 4 n=1 Tax=Ananas comosus TaxID=4615 RepID=A0A199V4Z8_ANACO|nr:putative membrane-associated kinase regulator 4 [Ananas comosus]
MSTNMQEKETTTSPADELFYKGNLLPLHLPPRLQMVQQLLNNTQTTNSAAEENIDTTTTTTITTTSVNVETNPEDYLECSARLIQSNPKRSWSKKLKLIRQTHLGTKIKASRDYIKSLFTKPSSSNDDNVYTKEGRKKDSLSQILQERYLVTETSATTLKSRIDREKLTEEDMGHRKSFSGIIKWRLTTKSSSSSSASSSCSSSFSSSSSSLGGNLSGLNQIRMLKRSNSVNSEGESSIQGAIAYCKKTQEMVSARKSVSDVGFYSFSVPNITTACESQERRELYRG